MKALTLTQPWASLVAIGAKRIETRSWSTSYRGPIAIHAARGFPGEAKHLCESGGICRAFGWQVCGPTLTQDWLYESARNIKALPLGCIVATAELVGTVPTDRHDFEVNGSFHYRDFTFEMTDQERNFGNYEPHRYGWILRNVVPLETPIAAKGALSLWEWAESAGTRPLYGGNAK